MEAICVQIPLLKPLEHCKRNSEQVTTSTPNILQQNNYVIYKYINRIILEEIKESARTRSLLTR
jgi:hypothetical protein